MKQRIGDYEVIGQRDSTVLLYDGAYHLARVLSSDCEERALNSYEVLAYLHRAGCKGIPVIETYYKAGVVIILLMRYMGSGWKSIEEQMSARSVYKVFYEAANTLLQIHDLGISHNALVPQNILWSDRGVMLVGFERACSILGSSSSTQGLVSCNNAIPHYSKFTAPEIVKGDMDNPQKSDIYSLGACFEQLVDDRGAQIIEEMMADDPRMRPDIYKILHALDLIIQNYPV